MIIRLFLYLFMSLMITTCGLCVPVQGVMYLFMSLFSKPPWGCLLFQKFDSEPWRYVQNWIFFSRKLRNLSGSNTFWQSIRVRVSSTVLVNEFDFWTLGRCTCSWVWFLNPEEEYIVLYGFPNRGERYNCCSYWVKFVTH